MGRIIHILSSPERQFKRRYFCAHFQEVYE
uniref:Uncharacterized protein n=1 Tax=Myoviridae sp. ctiBE32 TaxID=2826685 RepID=A0A8S5N801_9CAUD|nr:MAG TPA: hypothetical protein [Myoviridae sp. ctiBE32]